MRIAIICLFLLGASAGMGYCEASVSETPVTTVKAPPSPPPLTVFQKAALEADYRLRFNHIARDRVPALGRDTADNSINHRLRLGAAMPIQDDMLVIARATTQASRWGEFDVPNGRFTTRALDFDKLAMLWTADKETKVFAGRGTSRYFDIDLAIATGRFEDDDAFFEALLLEKMLADDTMLIVSYSPWLFSTSRLDADPREVNMGAYVLQIRKQFDPGNRLLLHLGILDPYEPLFGALGEKNLVAGAVRYDHRFHANLSVFASASLNLTQTNGFTFFALNDASASDRAAFFGGTSIGSSEKLHGSQLDLYFTKTGQFSTNLVSEFPSDIKEYRAWFSHQFRPQFWVRASAAHRVNEALPAGVTRDETDVAFIDVYKRF